MVGRIAVVEQRIVVERIVVVAQMVVERIVVVQQNEQLVVVVIQPMGEYGSIPVNAKLLLALVARLANVILLHDNRIDQQRSSVELARRSERTRQLTLVRFYRQHQILVGQFRLWFR